MKPSDDETWTEVERSFFAAAPPEEPQPLGDAPCFDDLPAPPPQRPRRELIAWLRPSVARAWRRALLVPRTGGRRVQRAWRTTALVAGAAGVSAQRAARTGVARLVAALSLRRVGRRRVVFALMGAIVAAGLTAGGVAFRKSGLTNGATAERDRHVSGPAIAEAAPAASSASRAAPRPNVRSSADVQAPRADVANRGPHAHRKHVSASSSAHRPMVTAFVDRETYWAREPGSAPVGSSRPLFSR